MRNNEAKPKVQYGPGAKWPPNDGGAATLAYLVRTMSLEQVCNVVAVILAERPDLDGRILQRFQRRINDMTWPLVTVDDEDVHNY